MSESCSPARGAAGGGGGTDGGAVPLLGINHIANRPIHLLGANSSGSSSGVAAGQSPGRKASTQSTSLAPPSGGGYTSAPTTNTTGTSPPVIRPPSAVAQTTSSGSSATPPPTYSSSSGGRRTAAARQSSSYPLDEPDPSVEGAGYNWSVRNQATWSGPIPASLVRRVSSASGCHPYHHARYGSLNRRRSSRTHQRGPSFVQPRSGGLHPLDGAGGDRRACSDPFVTCDDDAEINDDDDDVLIVSDYIAAEMNFIKEANNSGGGGGCGGSATGGLSAASGRGVHFGSSACGDDVSLYGTPKEEAGPGPGPANMGGEPKPSFIRNQLQALFQPTDNKLAMKLFGSKKALMKERIRQKAAGHWIIHPCSNFRYVFFPFSTPRCIQGQLTTSNSTQSNSFA